MTTGNGDVVIPTGSNVASTANSGLDSPVNRAVFNTTAMRELAEAMTEPPDPGAVNRRWGIVAAYNGPPTYTVDVTVGGVLVPGLAYDAAYTPTVNEVVMLDVVGTDTVVIGTTAPGQWRTGEIEPTFLPTPKSGALFCQGQTISRTTYANLWSWITANGLSGGKPFGNGDGRTTFTLPDLRGRMPIGAGTLGTDTYNVGDTPGAARVTLATAQMPAHQHSPTATTTVTDTGHTHSFGELGHTHSFGELGHTHGFSATSGGGSAHGHSVSADAQGGHGGHFPARNSSLIAAAGPDYGFAAWNDAGSAIGAHVHNMTVGNESGHTHSLSGTTGTSSAASGTTGTSSAASGTTGSTTATTTAATTVSETTVGGSTPVDVRQPAFVVNWLIYV